MKYNVDAPTTRGTARWPARRLHRLLLCQSGVTLVELVIALAIISLIGSGVVMAVHQLLTATRQANDQQYTVSQLRQAEHYITRDVLMTWQISSSGFPLSLYWEAENEDGDDLSYAVTYSLAGASGALKELNRALVVTDIATNVAVESSSLVVAQSIDDASSSVQFNDPTLAVTLVSVTGSHQEVRTFEVKPRKTEVEVI